MPLPLTMYGATDCEDTWQVREWLTTWHIPFAEVNIDHDAAAEQFVIFINGGLRRTPTLVFGAGKRKTIIVEPDDELLRTTLLNSGFAPGHQQHPANVDERTVLNYLLFDVRNHIAQLLGSADLVREGQIDLPQPIVDWFRRWQPAIEVWQQTQNWIRLQNQWLENVSIDTNQLIAKLAEGMQYVPDAATEAKLLTISESLLEKEFVGSTLRVIERLNLIYAMLVSGEYRQMYGWSVS